MKISTVAGLVDIGLLMEAMKEKENKKEENKNAKRKTPQKPSPCENRDK